MKMKIEKKYKFEKWNEWNHEIHSSAKDFYSEFNYNPNYLLANNHTFSQIDFISKIRPDIQLYKTDDITGKNYLALKNNEVNISTFTDFNDKNENYDICFAFDNKLKDKEFILIYDDEPDDEDEVPYIKTPLELTFA